MSDDGLVNREELVRLLGFNSWKPASRYVKLGIKYGLLKKDAIVVKMTDKNIESFWYPKTWVSTIKEDWRKSKEEGSKLPKPRARGKPIKSPFKASHRPVREERTICVTIPSQQAYELLMEQLGGKSGVSGFLLEQLKKKYEPKLSEISRLEQEFEAKQKQLQIELEQKLAALREKNFK